MRKIAEIINTTDHRSWKLPNGKWRYYQEWNNAVFLHWKIPINVLTPFIPKGLEIDIIEGETWISLVAFTMEKIRPYRLPAVSGISDFHEINLRAYVFKDNKPGVYFFSIEAQKVISAFIAKSLSGLPYEKANIFKKTKNNLITYISNNKIKNFKFEISYEIGDELPEKTKLDKWLIERYCLYLNKGKKLYRYEIHHKEWKLKEINLIKLTIDYKIGSLEIKDKKPDLMHYSDGVKVIAWKPQEI